MLNRQRDSHGPNVGWLFADLLLALAVIFLIANASGSIASPPRPPTPTPLPPPTPTAVPPPPPSTPYYFQFDVRFNDTALENGNGGSEANYVRNQIENALSGKGYASCHAVLVLVYGGTPSLADSSSRAEDAANAVISQLKTEGKKGFVFAEAQYHSPFRYSSSYGTVMIQVYFFDTGSQCEPPKNT